MQLPRRFFGWVLLSVLLISALAVACGDQPTPTATTAAPSPISDPTATVAPEPESTVTTDPEAMGATPSPTKIPDATALSPTPTAAPATMEPTANPTPPEVMERPNPEDVLTIALNELNDSGQSGWATLTARGDQTEVVLNISGGALETELVHIHSGQCGDTLGGVVHPLTSFVDGAGVSLTTVDAMLSSLRNGDFAINSHKKGEPGVYTSCGNIPTAAESVTIALNELNDSGQSGWATLTARGAQTEVVLNISGGALETELVHIHSGQCGDTLGGVVHPLTSFVDGAGVSLTTMDAMLSSLRNGDFAINSHKKGEPGVYTSCGNIPTVAESVTIALNELNDSGQSGEATLTARGDQTEVVLNISGGALETELVHIHSGQCGDTLGGVVHPLTSFVDGAGVSLTTVDAMLSSLRNGDFAINSHKKGEPGVYTSCGNIPGGETMAKSPIKEATMVTLRNFQIVPNVLEVRAGERARFSVSSTGAGHTFTIPALGVNVRLPAGTTRIVEFEVPDGASGDIQLLCRLHSSGGGGMVGKLRVNNGGGAY